MLPAKPNPKTADNTINDRLSPSAENAITDYVWIAEAIA